MIGQMLLRPRYLLKLTQKIPEVFHTSLLTRPTLMPIYMMVATSRAVQPEQLFPHGTLGCMLKPGL